MFRVPCPKITTVTTILTHDPLGGGALGSHLNLKTQSSLLSSCLALHLQCLCSKSQVPRVSFSVVVIKPLPDAVSETFVTKVLSLLLFSIKMTIPITANLIEHILCAGQSWEHFALDLHNNWAVDTSASHFTPETDAEWGWVNCLQGNWERHLTQRAWPRVLYV